MKPDAQLAGEWPPMTLTLRDYFAAKAMQGLITASKLRGLTDDEADFAVNAYKIADAMLEALK